MRGERAEPGLIFVYGALSPGVCLLVRDDVVLTVKTRELFRTEPRDRRLVPLPCSPQETRWRWDGFLDEAA
jgi:hypothetical protein